jgi:hypothetical protein
MTGVTFRRSRAIPDAATMSNSPTLIDSAPDALEQPADRLLRGIVAWSAIAYGGLAVAGAALYVALAAGWAAAPAVPNWGLDRGWQASLVAAHVLADVLLLAGGVLLRRRSRAGVHALRAGAVGSAGVRILAFALHSQAYWALWPTPAVVAMFILQTVPELLPPVVIGLLTLPPLARRMV